MLICHLEYLHFTEESGKDKAARGTPDPDLYPFKLGKADLTGAAAPRGPRQFENPRNQSSAREDGPRCLDGEGRAGAGP